MEGEFIRNVVTFQFIAGIQWIYNYYKTGIYNNWYYPFYNSPLVCDIHSYLNKKIILEEYKDPHKELVVTNTIQLLLVLPKESHHILTDEQRTLSKSVNYRHLYCDEFVVDNNLCTFTHQAVAFIPGFELGSIKNIG